MGNKFIHEGDEISPNNEPDEQGDEIKDLYTVVEHDPADRQADGRWMGTLAQEKVPVRYGIRWKRLYDKNSDKLYAPRQLIQKKHFRIQEEEDSF